MLLKERKRQTNLNGSHSPHEKNLWRGAHIKALEGLAGDPKVAATNPRHGAVSVPLISNLKARISNYVAPYLPVSIIMMKG